MAVIGEIAVAEVVGKDDDDVGRFVVCALSRGKRGDKGRNQGEEGDEKQEFHG